jgi:trehalose 6-phosphate synthase/phosphatase
MKIDFEEFAQAACSEETETKVAKLRATSAGQKVIFFVDRLDYTKGLINRLRGYELFLRQNPSWHGKVVFILSVAPSRTGVGAYQAMKQDIEQTVGRIVGAYGNVHWTPLIHQYRNLSFDEIVAMYRLCDVALITPLRDGMNLVAKEWLTTQAAEFILAIGDDCTDEDLFRALPPSAYSVRIGLAPTAAKYHLASHTAVRRLLRELINATSEKNG